MAYCERVFVTHVSENPYASPTPAQGMMLAPSSKTCIKILKALKDFHGEE
jgi:hypothetical protein